MNLFFLPSFLQYMILADGCLYHYLELLMPDSLPALLDSRSHLLQELSELGDFQPGSICSVTRRCGRWSDTEQRHGFGPASVLGIGAARREICAGGPETRW